jgi:alpha-tubulin suppressor-like RCC1 family protein
MSRQGISHPSLLKSMQGSDAGGGARRAQRSGSTFPNIKIPERRFIVLIALLFCAWASAQTATTSGRLWAMGNNSAGELGDGTTTSHACPVPVLSEGVQAVAAGNDFSLILKADGSLWAMGDNSYGELGDGTTTQRNSPKQILPGGVQAIAAGNDFSLILKTDGSLWAMGGNS